MALGLISLASILGIFAAVTHAATPTSLSTSTPSQACVIGTPPGNDQTGDCQGDYQYGSQTGPDVGAPDAGLAGAEIDG